MDELSTGGWRAEFGEFLISVSWRWSILGRMSGRCRCLPLEFDLALAVSLLVEGFSRTGCLERFSLSVTGATFCLLFGEVDLRLGDDLLGGEELLV